MGQSDRPSGFSRFAAEMKRRHVVRFALGYAAAAFVVLQLAEIVFPAFGIGEDGLRVLVVLTALGFLPALVLAWVYDITTEGIKRTEEGEESGAPPSRLAVTALLVTTLTVTGALGLYLADQGVLSTTGDPSVADVGPVLTVAYDPSAPIRSLAVLPLDDYSPSGDQAYFTSGMHEELIAKLSLLEDVRVVSRTTVMRYGDPETRPASPQIGRELGVDALIEGSVTRSENLVRVTLQIIHAPSDSHIKTLQWERENVADILAFQTEIAQTVVDSIPGDHDSAAFDGLTVASVDPEAQDSYLRARHEYDRGTADGYRMALEYFEDAVEEDPDFAAAMAGLAGARFLVGLEDPEAYGEEISLARKEARMALDLDSTSMEAKEVLSFIERGVPTAIDLVVEAPQGGAAAAAAAITDALDPGIFDQAGFDTTWVAAITGLGEHIDEQLRRRGIGSRADSGARQASEARRLMASGRYLDAATVLESVVERTPDMAPAWDMLARSHVAVGDADEAARIVMAWHESGAPNAPDEGWVSRLEDAVEGRGAEGYWEWKLERLMMEDAEGRHVARVELAAAHAALGNEDEAFRYLFEALERGEPGIMTLRSDPVWDDLRGDTRFRRIARQAQSLRFSWTRRSPRSGGPGR